MLSPLCMDPDSQSSRPIAVVRNIGTDTQYPQRLATVNTLLCMHTTFAAYMFENIALGLEECLPIRFHMPS